MTTSRQCVSSKEFTEFQRNFKDNFIAHNNAVLVNTRWKVIQNCHVYQSIEFDSDHRTVVSIIAINLRCEPPKKSVKPLRYIVSRLADPVVQEQFAV